MSFTTPLPDSKINQDTRNKLGEAIYLLAHIIRKADWKSGKLRTNRQKISRETGFPENTIKRWMQRLIDVGEIVSSQMLHCVEISIVDYDAIARTRGVKKAGFRRVKSDPDEPQKSAIMGVKTDPDHVIRILSQNNKKNSFQILSSSLCDKEELSESDTERPENPRSTGEFDTDRHERIAREFMASADKAAKQELIDEALKSMENDPRPFIRIFIKRNEQGDREFVSHSGDAPLMARIGMLLESREDES